MNSARQDFLLDLFYAGYKHAYVSVMDLNLVTSAWAERIEIILPNVGRLCVYQGFMENDNGEQIPKFRVFCNASYNKNRIERIRNLRLVSKAICLAYKSAKYMQSKTQNQEDDEIIKAVIRNHKFLQKKAGYFIKASHGQMLLKQLKNGKIY